MIHQVEGDIIYTSAQALVHGVAANDPMTQGLAKMLHEKYPAMHKDFHRWCHKQHRKPGEAWMWSAPNGDCIITLLTQEGGYGHGARPGKASRSNVNHALRALKKIVGKQKLRSLALPCLATGVGGLLWDDVWPLIQDQLGELEIPVFVYTSYCPGQRAKEPL